MKTISPEEFDRLFDEGEVDILEYCDLSRGTRLGLETKRANVDFPVWMLNSLDLEAKRLGVTRQSIIKLWIGAKLDEIKKGQVLHKSDVKKDAA